MLCSNDPERLAGLGNDELYCLEHVQALISCYQFGAGQCFVRRSVFWAEVSVLGGGQCFAGGFLGGMWSGATLLIIVQG